MTAFDGEDSLAAFIQQQIDGSSLGVLIRQLQANFGALLGKKIGIGASTLAFGGSATSGVVAVNHGFGVAPAEVFAQPIQGAAKCLIEVTAVDAVAISFIGYDIDGIAQTGTNDFYWWATT